MLCFHAAGKQQTLQMTHAACCLMFLLQTAGSEQAPLVQQLLQQQQAGSAPAFRDVRVHEDCYGVPRFVSATRT
jgi:hypothetical protein